MLITSTKIFAGKVYVLSPTGNRNKRAAQALANELRRKGWSARVVGDSKIGWWVYKRR